MAGECCGPTWRAVDRWVASQETPLVDEVDPLWRLALPGGARAADRTLAAPQTQAISLDYDAGSGRVRVVGSPGAAPEDTTILVGNLDLNDFAVLRSDAFGAFEAELVGAPGSYILIKQDVTGTIIREEEIDQGSENMIAPGVLMRIPTEPAPEGVPFASAARLCCNGGRSASWTIEGSFDRDTLEAGYPFLIYGRLTLLADESAQPPATYLNFFAYLMGDAQGRQVGRAGKFVSPYLTNTGLPIERSLNGPPLAPLPLGGARVTWEFDGRRWTADFSTFLTVPPETRTGVYALTAGNLWDLRDVEPAGTRPFNVVIRDQAAHSQDLASFTVGDPAPMRLATTLLADEVSEGSHGGVLAREDQGLFDISGRALTRHNPIIPRLDGYGEPWSYRLEPYAPMLDVVDRAVSNGPALPLDFSDSELSIAIHRPDGGTDVLGPAPLTRLGVKSARAPWGPVALGLGGGELREIPQLMGDDNTFAYQFPTDGDYVVTIDGRIADTTGRTHLICGTYDVTVANILDIETAMLPTTPFEVGDSIAPTLSIMPGVPAQVTYTVTHVAADGDTTARTFSGTANRFGWWDGGGEVWTFQRDGEYRVDVDARYTDSNGNLWAGRLRFGSAVATPDAPLVAHGRRGSDGLPEISRPWMFERDFVYDEDASAPHMHFPYFTGDILWGTERLHEEREDTRNAGTAVVTEMSAQPLDLGHPLIARARQQLETTEGLFYRFPIEDSVRAGQMPLLMAGPPEQRGRASHPDEIYLWAYTYSSAERPGVRVRETIQGDDIPGAYWRFGDAYSAQSGNGNPGDLPGDFKFLYSAAVIRDPASGEGVYAIYGSGWILLPDDDPLGARVLPPFRGAGGGLDGGPLFTVHGRPIDNMFFLPLGVRPGAVLETGDVFRMAGPIMPTLPSRIAYTVTAPDGAQRSFTGRANAVGYFYDPTDDFVLDQPGLWTVDIGLTHEGQTSVGPVEPPFPTGGPLTPDGATFTFVVAGEQTQVLDIETDLTLLTPPQWYAGYPGVPTAFFEARLPAGWSGATARVVVTMPGIVLVDEDIPVTNGAIRWDLDAPLLNRLASNFDYESGMADTITVTVFAESTTGSGIVQATGSIVTHGARVPVAPTPA